MHRRDLVSFVLGLAVLAFAAAHVSRQPDPLQSWNESAAKKSIAAFVTRITVPGRDRLTLDRGFISLKQLRRRISEVPPRQEETNPISTSNRE